MQKIIGLFLLLFSVSTLAHIYCPSQVICEEAAQVDSCHFEQTLRGFWQWVPGKRTQPVLAGIYYHTYASAPDVNDASGYAICVYTHEAMAQTLSLRAQPGFNIVADFCHMQVGAGRILVGMCAGWQRFVRWGDVRGW